MLRSSLLPIKTHRIENSSTVETEQLSYVPKLQPKPLPDSIIPYSVITIGAVLEFIGKHAASGGLYKVLR